MPGNALILQLDLSHWPTGMLIPHPPARGVQA